MFSQSADYEEKNTLSVKKKKFIRNRMGHKTSLSAGKKNIWLITISIRHINRFHFDQ